MSTASTPVEIEYPESDGQPMGETDLHRNWMMRLIELLQHRYHNQQVYVSGDLLVYYEEGTPHKFVVPDAFVVQNCDPGERRTYKIWEEPAPPQVVFEVTSRSSKREDTIHKPRTYAQIGVREYFVYDPTQDYLDPPLRGYRLAGDEHVPIEPDANGTLHCEELDLMLNLDGLGLVLRDGSTGDRLLLKWEAEQAAKEAEKQAYAAEHQARLDAEAEVDRLREQLRQSGQDV